MDICELQSIGNKCVWKKIIILLFGKFFLQFLTQSFGLLRGHLKIWA